MFGSPFAPNHSHSKWEKERKRRRRNKGGRIVLSTLALRTPVWKGKGRKEGRKKQSGFEKTILHSYVVLQYYWIKTLFFPRNIDCFFSIESIVASARISKSRNFHLNYLLETGVGEAPDDTKEKGEETRSLHLIFNPTQARAQFRLKREISLSPLSVMTPRIGGALITIRRTFLYFLFLLLLLFLRWRKERDNNGLIQPGPQRLKSLPATFTPKGADFPPKSGVRKYGFWEKNMDSRSKTSGPKKVFAPKRGRRRRSKTWKFWSSSCPTLPSLRKIPR